ncbi:MAG TPA: hypothetical protein VFO36_12630, partial [Nitrospiraceae bacterium]|nr:hypothetical protein [Nitrospiraceae bacterium]
SGAASHRTDGRGALDRRPGAGALGTPRGGSWIGGPALGPRYTRRGSRDQDRLVHDVSVLSTFPTPTVEWRRKEISIADIEWSSCPKADAGLLARCLRAVWEGQTAVPSSDWEDLYQVMAAYFADQTVEAAVSEVVFVTAEHPDRHRECLGILDKAIGAATRSDPGVAASIARSFAASVHDAEQARAYLEAVRAEYLRQYDAKTQSKLRSPSG